MEESANARTVRAMFVEFGSLANDPALMDAWLTRFTEDVVWDALEDAPDAGTYRGHAEIRGYAEDWIATVDDAHVELRALEEVAGCVAGECHFAARIKGTESELAFDFWQVWRLDGGKIRRVKEFRERDEAIAFAEAGAPDP